MFFQPTVSSKLIAQLLSQLRHVCQQVKDQTESALLSEKALLANRPAKSARQHSQEHVSPKAADSLPPKSVPQHQHHLTDEVGERNEGIKLTIADEGISIRSSSGNDSLALEPPAEEWPVLSSVSTTAADLLMYTDSSAISEEITLSVTIPGAACATDGGRQIFVRILPHCKLLDYCTSTKTPHFYSSDLLANSFRPLEGLIQVEEGGQAWLTLRRPVDIGSAAGVSIPASSLLALCQLEKRGPLFATAGSFRPVKESHQVRR